MRKGSHDPKKMDAAMKDWNAGSSWPEIAERYDFPSTPAAMMAVRMHAKRNGLKLRFANGRNDEARRAKSAAMRDQGYSLKEIAIELAWSDGGAAQRGIERYDRAQAIKRMTKPGDAD